MYRILK